MFMYSAAWYTCIFFNTEYCYNKLLQVLIGVLSGLNMLAIKNIFLFFAGYKFCKVLVLCNAILALFVNKRYERKTYYC